MTRLGDFWKILATNFPSKVAQKCDDFLDLLRLLIGHILMQIGLHFSLTSGHTLTRHLSIASSNSCQSTDLGFKLEVSTTAQLKQLELCLGFPKRSDQYCYFIWLIFYVIQCLFKSFWNWFQAFIKVRRLRIRINWKLLPNEFGLTFVLLQLIEHSTCVAPKPPPFKTQLKVKKFSETLRKALHL